MGLLQVSCVSADPRIRQSWPLEFNLRPHEQDSEGAPGSETSSEFQFRPDRIPQRTHSKPPKYVSPRCLPDASAKLTNSPRRGLLRAWSRFSACRKANGMPPSSALSGQLWKAAWRFVDGRQTTRKPGSFSPASYCALGLGHRRDDARIDSLWRLRDIGLDFPGKRIKFQEYILWRRVAGGLTRRVRRDPRSRARQDPPTQSPPAELIRLAGSLERLPHETKAGLITRFIDTAADLATRRSTVLHTLPRWATSQPSAALCRTRDGRLARPCRERL